MRVENSATTAPGAIMLASALVVKLIQTHASRTPRPETKDRAATFQTDE
jgi:hypothetical protein